MKMYPFGPDRYLAKYTLDLPLTAGNMPSGGAARDGPHCLKPCWFVRHVIKCCANLLSRQYLGVNISCRALFKKRGFSVVRMHWCQYLWGLY